MPVVDVFVDCSRVSAGVQLSAAFARLDGPDVLGGIAGRVTCAVPSNHAEAGGLRMPGGWRVRTSEPVAACSLAMAEAADAGRPLLVLFGTVEPGCEAVGLLLDAIDSDPMIGFACPRVKGTRDHSVARLDAGGDRAIDDLPRRVLAELPETALVADGPARCLLIKPAILANFGALERRFRTVAAALWHVTGRARRCGFRTLVCHRAVVAVGSTRASTQACEPSAIAFRQLPEADRVLLRELLPDVERAHEEFGTGALVSAETRLARALPQAYETRPSLLLDVRNVVSGMNGTAMAALGISGGLHALELGWDVTLLASRDARTFHKLEALYPDWEVITSLPDRQFTAALRLSQPWRIQEMVDLHDAAACNVYLFLDTISWDIAYQAPRHLEGAWHFMAEQADGLLFISEFTRDRFYRRFAAGARVPGLVSYLSFDPADYVLPDIRPARDRDGFIFVVGNDYDHKDVAQTIDVLTTAFPYQEIVALGGATAATPRVTVLQSGRLSDLDIHRLYAGARLVVFPSFYEGFGFPILTTLAYGRTLLARRSTLLDEIAARCATRGRVIAFDRREELVELMGRLLHGETVTSLPLGTALDEERPASWQDVARSIMRFVSTRAGDLSKSHWRSRDHIIRQLMAAPVSLVEGGLRRPGAR